MKLAGSHYGRITLHLICLCQDGKLQWHMRGIVRELPKLNLPAGYFNYRQIGCAPSTPDASAFARGVEVIHDTVFLKKPTKCAA